MKHIVTRLFATAALALVAATTQAQGRPVAEGPVLYFSYIKVMPGQFDNYMKYMAATWVPIMEEQKKAGLILDFSVYHALAPEADEPEIILATTYANMAALDDLDAKLDPLLAKVWGTMEKVEIAKADRSTMRRDLGGDMFRQLVFRKPAEATPR